MLSGSVLQFSVLMLRGRPVWVLSVYGRGAANIQRGVLSTVAGRRGVGREAGHTAMELASIRQETACRLVAGDNP